jgi:polygalacturonase
MLVEVEYHTPPLTDHVSAGAWFFDDQNATFAIQSAIDSGAPTVFVPNVGRPYYVDPITLASDQTLILEEGVVIAARAGSFRGRGDCLFSGENQKNLAIVGYGAVIEMRKQDYQKRPYEKAEWRHAIFLAGCSNVLIEGVTIRSSGGDGIYVGRGRGEGAKTYCENIVVKNVLLDDHHRQGISVISARNLLIENVQIYNTSGTLPRSGIDFEPNRRVEILENCVVRNCEIAGNRGPGILFSLQNLHPESQPISIIVEDCTIYRNAFSIMVVGLRHGASGEIHFSGNDIRGVKFIQPSKTLTVSFR